MVRNGKVILIGKVVFATLIMFISWSVASGVIMGVPEDQGNQSLSAILLLVVCLANTLVAAFLILRSAWHGWKLSATAFAALFGVQTFMSQIETVFFNDA